MRELYDRRPEYLAEIAAMQREHEERHRLHQRWIIAETEGGFLVLDFHGDGVAPPAIYPVKELAAARVLQLMGITHAIMPQSFPNEVCIGTVTEIAPCRHCGRPGTFGGPCDRGGCPLGADL